MSDLSIIPANVKRVSGKQAALPAAYLVLTGEIVGGNPANKVANTAEIGSGGFGIALALSTAGTGQYANLAVKSAPNGSLATVVDLGVSTTNNTLYFLSENAGKICPYADLESGDKIVLLGIGLGSNRLLFYPVDTGLIR